jgi:hypothetical protein
LPGLPAKSRADEKIAKDKTWLLQTKGIIGYGGLKRFAVCWRRQEPQGGVERKSRSKEGVHGNAFGSGGHFLVRAGAARTGVDVFGAPALVRRLAAGRRFLPPQAFRSMVGTRPGGERRLSARELTMPFSIYQASVPVFIQVLQNLSAILAKAAAHAEARKVEPAVFCQLRLYPDMLPLSRQVSLACDFAKLATARLAAVEAPKYADDERDFTQLQERIARTLDFIRSVPQAEVEAGAERSVTMKLPNAEHTFSGPIYLMHVALPNFFFHITTAYAILRTNGVELGKLDFIGSLPS